MLELYEQTRLANARCANYPYQLAAAGFDLSEQHVQGRQLVLTLHKYSPPLTRPPRPGQVSRAEAQDCVDLGEHGRRAA
jgi:hypothetical protein